jgi:ribosome modulation factor
MSGFGMECCASLLRHLHLTLTFRYGIGALAGMSNHPSTTSSAPSFLAAALNAVRRFCRGDGVPPAAPSAMSREGSQAFADGLPLSICPYVRTQEVDRWRAGWFDAQRQQEAFAALAECRREVWDEQRRIV